MRQQPVKRHFPRNLRNKPCLCGAMKPKPAIRDKVMENLIRGFRANDIVVDEVIGEPIMVPVKAKHCCLPKVNASYHSSLEKYMPNTGKRKYGN